MSGLNKAQVIGHLGRDPEIRYATSGTAVCNITVATSRTWKDKTSGERQEETEWHRLVAYDKLAEIIWQYLKKGSQAYFEGRLKTRKWTDKDGVERYTTEIVVEQMTMLGGKGEGEPQGQPPPRKPQSTAPQPSTKPVTTGSAFDDMDDDIPFVSADCGLDMESRHARRMRRYA